MDWGHLGLGILEYLFPVLAAVLTALVSWGLTKLFSKWGIELDLTKDAAVRQAIRIAIGGAEEWAARRLKLEDKKVESSEKAKWVHDVVSRTWPKLLPNDLDTMIDEELASMRGVGATGNQVVGIDSEPVGSYAPIPNVNSTSAVP